MSLEQTIDNGEATRLRAFCARDLIETEKNYLEALHRLSERYREPLLHFVVEHPCSISPRDVDLLIPDQVEKIFIPLHNNFEARLRPACQQIADNLNPTNLLLLFTTDLPFLIAHYKDHCRSQFERIDMLRKMKEDRAFAGEILRLEQAAGTGQTLESELSKLPTRIMRYSLLLTDLTKYVDGCEQSKRIIQNTSLLTASRNAINKVTNHINEECRWVDAKYMNVLLENINLLPNELMRPILKMRTDMYEGVYNDQECKVLVFDEGVVIVRSGVGHARNEFVKLISLPMDVSAHNSVVRLSRKDDPGDENDIDNVTQITIVKQTSFLHSAQALGVKAAELLENDIKTLSNSQVKFFKLNAAPLHRGFPSCSIDRAARIRCAITFAVLSTFYVLGASLHSDVKSERGLWNRFANIQLKLFGYFLPFGWVLGLHYQYVVHVKSDLTRFWKEFCADVSSWAHIYLIARFVIEPLSNILWPILTFGRMSLTVGKDRNGAASHAILTLIACGYAMLASDSKWFQWSSFQSMLDSPKPSQRYSARVLLGSGIYLVFLYCNMAFTTTRYYHTLEEFITGLCVATFVLASYVWSFDYFSDTLKYVAAPERQRRMVFIAVFASALVFIFILACFVIIQKRYIDVAYRVASGFFVFTSAGVASFLSLSVGTIILFLCHGDIVLALQCPLWSLFTTILFLSVRWLFGSERALVGAYTSWYVVFFSFVACTLQVVDVAMFSHRLPNSNSISFIPTSWSSRGTFVFQEILLSLLPLFYFLLCLQLFAHFYYGVMFVHDYGSLWWLPLPIALSTAGGYLQPRFKDALISLSKLNRSHEE